MILDAIVKDIKTDSGEFTMKRTGAGYSVNYSTIVDVFIDNGYMVLLEPAEEGFIKINFWKTEV